MPGKKASVNRQNPGNSLRLGPEARVDALSALPGAEAVSWDPELLRPFLSQRVSNPRPSEADIFREAITEGTAYLLYQRMKEAPNSELQLGWLFLKLQQSYYHNLVQNIYWSEQFLKDYPIITDGSSAILLKGISLLNTVYQNPGLRHLGDIDLLIRKQTYPEIREKLESAGYVFSDEMQGLADPRNLNSILCHKKSPSTPNPLFTFIGISSIPSYPFLLPTLEWISMPFGSNPYPYPLIPDYASSPPPIKSSTMSIITSNTHSTV